MVQWQHGEYLNDTGKSELNLAFTHAFMTASSWAPAPWLYQKVGYEAVNSQDYVWHSVRPGIYRQQYDKRR
ncbi:MULTISPECIES: hypothetical protein [unclassified Serratia (in: enterobacteria)]|uniref:hypothetical protein n=1 Tax=unclassified Serratia (in: enterobacteria) TaxID=2647522 RepID=UPI002ED15DC4|nr:hypothetical protein [Serratia sp. C2(2)]MEE4446871.1 hypothetical protein [Serratia sp. C2(1)]